MYGVYFRGLEFQMRSTDCHLYTVYSVLYTNAVIQYMYTNKHVLYTHITVHISEQAFLRRTFPALKKHNLRLKQVYSLSRFSTIADFINQPPPLHAL